MRLIDADKIRYVYAPIAPVLVGDEEHYENIAFQSEIEKLPTVYAAPVIRCHNCRFYRPINGEIGECCHTKGTQWYVSREGFCDRAEVK